MTPEMQIGVILVGGLLFIVTLLAFFWPTESDLLKKRIGHITTHPLDNPAERTKGGEHGHLKRDMADSNIPFFDRLIKSFLPNPDRMRMRLAKTGKDIHLGAYLLVNALCVVSFFALFSIKLEWSLIVSIFASIAIGLFLPHAVIGRMGNKRIDKFLSFFPEAIDTMCRGLRSGLPITESIASVGREMLDPIGTEFRHVSDAVRMGRSLEEAMWDVSRRLDTPEFRFFIIAMAIQKETGGNLAETLGNLADLLRKRRQLRLKIKAMSSEAKASAMIIGSLPFVMFSLLMVVNPDYALTLMYDPKGKIMLGFAGSLIGMGIFVMKTMVNFEL